jgi:hypothetical protein
MLEQVTRRYPPVHKASVAFPVPAKDRLFYMGSMHHRKIVKFVLDGRVSDFVKEDLYE